MTNIDAINPRHTKTYSVTKNHGFPWKIYDILLPNGMPYNYHMRDRTVINCKGEQYSQLANKWN